LTRLQVHLLLAAAGASALLGGYWVAQLLRAPATIPAAAPGFIEISGTDLQGQSRRLSEWRGRVIVLNFWATWCPPCREEIPLFIAMQERHGPQGVQVVGVAIDQLPEVMTYARDVKLNYPTLIADGSIYQVMQAYGNTSTGLPFSVVFDRNGIVRSRKLGAFRGDELEQALAPLIGSSTAEKR
jgi:thiol-disulfide isomerase/thioredoxin